MRKTHPGYALAAMILLTCLTKAGADNPLDQQIKGAAVDAAAVISDFGINHDEAAAKYSRQAFLLEGRVIAIGGAVKGSAGGASAHLQLGPVNADTKNTMVLWVDLAPTAVDLISKLAKGDLVNVNVTYTTTPASEHDHTIRGFTATSGTKAAARDSKNPKLRDQMLDWVRKNQSMKPAANGADNALVRKMAAQIDGSLATANDFSILFGAGLMKSNKSTALCEQDGKMFVEEYTGEQFAGTKLGPMSTTVMDAPTKAVKLAPLAELSTPVLEGGGTWNINQPLKGTVTIRTLPHFPADPKGLAVRMVCYAGNLRVIFASPFNLTLDQPGTGTTTLKFEGGNDAKTALMSAKPPGPRVVFFELVQINETDKESPQKIISDPAAVILNITEK
jgi:hypothetical protein